MSERFTVFGGHGFIGGEVARQLETAGCGIARIGRNDWPPHGAQLGHVIYAIGMTADFRQRLAETIELNVGRLHEALSAYAYESFLYLSSARVYAGANHTVEDAELCVKPMLADHTYNISKLAGESRCLAEENPSVRVVRPSNVFGRADRSNLFLTAILREAVATGKVTIHQSPDSEKDYVLVSDLAQALIAIARGATQRLYNLASGRNLSHRRIAGLLERHGVRVTFSPNAPRVIFPPISTQLFQREFGIPMSDPATGIDDMLSSLRLKTERP